MASYQRTRNRALLAKVEATPGTYETTAGATDAIPLEDVQTPVNPVVIQTNEARNTLSASPRLVARFEPTLTGSFLMRGSGAVGTAPRTSPILRALGMAETVSAVLPATGVFAVASGTTTTAVVTNNVGTGTQLPSTNGALIGRWATLAVNPATPVIAGIVGYTVSGTSTTITFDRTFGAALDATTTIVVMPCVLYKPTDATPSAISWDKFLDGRHARFSGGRGTGGFTFPGNDLPRLNNVNIQGQYVTEDDASPTGIDFSTQPAPPQWSDGVCILNRVVRACSSLDFALGNAITRYPNPNLPGPDLAIITARDVTGTINMNSELVAVDPSLTQILANTAVPFSAGWNLDGSAGTRMGLVIPALQRNDRTEGDREGVAEDNFPFAANPVYGGDEFVLAMCL